MFEEYLMLPLYGRFLSIHLFSYICIYQITVVGLDINMHLAYMKIKILVKYVLCSSI